MWSPKTLTLGNPEGAATTRNAADGRQRELKTMTLHPEIMHVAATAVKTATYEGFVLWLKGHTHGTAANSLVGFGRWDRNPVGWYLHKIGRDAITPHYIRCVVPFNPEGKPRWEINFEEGRRTTEASPRWFVVLDDERLDEAVNKIAAPYCSFTRPGGLNEAIDAWHALRLLGEYPWPDKNAHGPGPRGLVPLGEPCGRVGCGCGKR